MTRRLLRRHLDMPDPRGLFLGPILRGEHVFAIYLGPSAIQQALGPPPDHQMYVCAMPMGRQLGRAAATPTRPHLGHLRLRLRPPRGALLVMLVVAAAATALVPAPRLLRRSSSTRLTSHGARATHITKIIARTPRPPLQNPWAC